MNIEPDEYAAAGCMSARPAYAYAGRVNPDAAGLGRVNHAMPARVRRRIA